MTERAPLRVLTWNILRWGRTDRLAALAQHIAAVDADLVLLQEADTYTTTELARQLGYNELCPAAGPANQDDPSQSHPCALTRIPTRKVGRIELEPPRADRQPAALRFEAELDADRWIEVTTVHLSHTHQAGRLGLDRPYLLWDYEGASWTGPRADSVRRRLAQIPRVFANPPAVGLITGDVNCLPFGPEFRAIGAFGWQDAWSAAPRLGSAATIPAASPYTAVDARSYADTATRMWPRATGPSDYTLDAQFSRGLVASWAWTLGRGSDRSSADPGHTVTPTDSSWVVADWPSDHLGLVVDYEFPWRLGSAG